MPKVHPAPLQYSEAASADSSQAEVFSKEKVMDVITNRMTPPAGDYYSKEYQDFWQDIEKNLRNTINKEGLIKQGYGVIEFYDHNHDHIKYEGCFKNFMAHGPGKLYTKEGTIEGVFQDGYINCTIGSESVSATLTKKDCRPIAALGACRDGKQLLKYTDNGIIFEHNSPFAIEIDARKLTQTPAAEVSQASGTEANASRKMGGKEGGRL